MAELTKEEFESMKSDCLSEYPYPYFSDDKRLYEFTEKMLEEYPEATFHGQFGYGMAVCLDDLSRLYYAIMMLGASRAMSYYSMGFNRDSGRWKERKERFLEEYEIEGIINNQRKAFFDESRKEG